MSVYVCLCLFVSVVACLSVYLFTFYHEANKTYRDFLLQKYLNKTVWIVTTEGCSLPNSILLG